jgi:predicted phosphodiesterase
MRIFALSDIHADYAENRAWVHRLSAADYLGDALILAGDISHDLQILADVLGVLRSKFKHLVFVPGNHDLWLRGGKHKNSLERFRVILDMCRGLGVETAPLLVDASKGSGVWLVPLQSWYEKPGESPHSLYVPKAGEDPLLRMWVDDRAVRWPDLNGCATTADFFLSLNTGPPGFPGGAQVITCSHFLPRTELMFPDAVELTARAAHLRDSQPRFNFSRVAGTLKLDTRIRQLSSCVHVYGHQHRNRCRMIDGVTYVSHCLGYPRERAEGRIAGNPETPLLIWDTHAPHANNPAAKPPQKDRAAGKLPDQKAHP